MTFPTPLPAAAAIGSVPGLLEPQLVQGLLFWLEQRPQEGGRTTLMLRSGHGLPARELTPAPWNLRSRTHTYGGGACSIGALDDGSVAVVFVDATDGRLWQLRLDRQGHLFTPPAPLTAPAPEDCHFGGGLIDGPGRRWIGVREWQGRDALVAVPLKDAAGVPTPSAPPQVLHQALDFCGYPALSPRGRQLAWVEWQQPFMPWDRSQLWLAAVQTDGSLAQPRRVAGSDGDDTAGVAVFQPLWLTGAAAGDLVVACDRSGWWNLDRLVGAEDDVPDPEGRGGGRTTRPTWEALLPLEADLAPPQWVFGMRTIAWDGQHLLALACRDGRWSLGEIRLDRPVDERRWQPLDLPFDDLEGLSADNGHVVLVAGEATTPSGLLEIALESGQWQHSPASRCPLPPEQLSRPQAVHFAGHGGAPTQAWYYPPGGGGQPEAPQLIRSHSGPTAMARTGLNLGIQFWTSRGWGVIDVNYGGSSGFGRAYRERLNGQWGIVDVDDCLAAARTIVERGLASARRVAMEGGSAGGFTTLAALARGEGIQAGACRYAVADLTALVHDGHRFEAGYLDTLIAPWPDGRVIYESRSPLNLVERFEAPRILVQGDLDPVVPPTQTEAMAEALRRRGVPVEVHHFAHEGHGFRDGAVRQAVLEATEAFFRRHLLP
ncbi:MAG: alpha/beta hydrolase family protein [Cyanobacteriota bacterium]